MSSPTASASALASLATPALGRALKIERLVADGRAFVKGLRYNLGAGSALASATLTDCEGSAPLLFVVHAGVEDSGQYLQMCDPLVPVWLWNPSSEAMPSLPPQLPRHPRAAESAVERR